MLNDIYLAGCVRAPLGSFCSAFAGVTAVDLGVTAAKAAFERSGAKPESVKEVDLFEINEAFSVVPMAAMQDLKIPHEKTNVHGRAVCLGHPVGASGTRIFATLINALQTYGKKTGVASLFIGGGMVIAIAIELA